MSTIISLDSDGKVGLKVIKTSKKIGEVEVKQADVHNLLPSISLDLFVKGTSVPLASGPRAREHKNIKLACYVDGKYLEAQELRFVQYVIKDISNFLESGPNKRALVFPPFLSGFRYLGHKIVEEFFPSLCSFSVGDGDVRSIVVCLSSIAQRSSGSYRCIHEKLQQFRPKYFVKNHTCVCNSRKTSVMLQDDNSAHSSSSQESQESQLSLPEVRAANIKKKHEKDRLKLSIRDTNNECISPVDKSESSLVANTRMKQKRPDMPLYVPRARRLQQGTSVESLSNIGKEPVIEKKKTKKISQRKTSNADNQFYIPQAQSVKQDTLIPQSGTNKGVEAENTFVPIDTNKLANFECQHNKSAFSQKSNKKIRHFSSGKKEKLKKNNEHILSNQNSHSSEETWELLGEKSGQYSDSVECERPSLSLDTVRNEVDNENEVKDSKCEYMAGLSTHFDLKQSNIISSKQQNCEISFPLTTQLQMFDKIKETENQLCDIASDSSLKTDILMTNRDFDEAELSKQYISKRSRTEQKSVSDGVDSMQGCSSQSDDEEALKDCQGKFCEEKMKFLTADGECAVMSSSHNLPFNDETDNAIDGSVAVKSIFNNNNNLSSLSSTSFIKPTNKVESESCELNSVLLTNFTLNSRLPDDSVNITNEQNQSTTKLINSTVLKNEICSSNSSHLASMLSENPIENEENLNKLADLEPTVSNFRSCHFIDFGQNVNTVSSESKVGFCTLENHQNSASTSDSLELVHERCALFEATDVSQLEMEPDKHQYSVDSNSEASCENVAVTRKLCDPSPVMHCKDQEIPLNISDSDSAEDSWDSMFNDDGECLNPEVLRELIATVGNVNIQKPKCNYYEFQPHDPEISNEEYGHIVELYGFPPEFKTQDLISAFSLFKAQGFDIKWVDDCHALGVFSSPFAATEALTLKHPFVKVRPLSQGIRESKLKAKKCSEFLQCYKPRPATSAALARRLVSGALGLKVHIPKEQREVERRKLQEAKERKRQAARKRQNIWDGVIS